MLVPLPPRRWKTKLYKLFGLTAPDRYVVRPSQGADRKPQPPTRSIVGGPGEDQSAATLDRTSNR